MPRVSAGILLYRIIDNKLQFFLVHPGGPFFIKKDDGHWTIPKGEPSDNEELSSCALREFREETGFSISGEMIELTPVVQKGGKKVFAWTIRATLILHKSNPTFLNSNGLTSQGGFNRFQKLTRHHGLALNRESKRSILLSNPFYMKQQQF